MSLSNADFKVSGACKIISSANFDIGTIPPFLRVLLTTDGTVTKSLEAYFWEDIAVELVRQAEMGLNEHVDSIECGPGDRVLSRCVQLTGKDSGVVYVQAKSLIRMELLPKRFQHELIAKRLGIGELVRECGLETYREIMCIGKNDRGDELWRTYRIFMAHKPIIQITEHFPCAVYARA